MRRAVLVLAALLDLGAGEPRFELRGRIEPPPGMITVMLRGADFPYAAQARCDPSGRFRFGRLASGAYTVIAYLPGAGEIRRTVVVSRALADEKGRISLVLSSEAASAAAIAERQTVSVRELAIPGRALQEYAKAEQRLHQRDVEGAKRHLARAVQIAPRFVAAWNYLGTIAYQSGEYEQAEKYFRTALEHEPGAFTPAVNLGGTLLSMRRFEEALPYNQYCAAERPDDALANSQLGQNYFFLGNFDRAVEYLEKAKRLDPAHFSQPQLVLAEIYSRRGDRTRAIAELEDFLARHPESRNAEAARQWLAELRGR